MSALIPSETAGQEQAMEAAEVRTSAVADVAVVAGRRVSMRLIRLGGTIVLARLLAPHDFGLFALGQP
jgi:O-antigen/teichoic acid export membrane protein